MAKLADAADLKSHLTLLNGARVKVNERGEQSKWLGFTLLIGIVALLSSFPKKKKKSDIPSSGSEQQNNKRLTEHSSEIELPLTKPPKRLPEWTMAAATVLLVAVTAWYAMLTNRLLEVQVEPSLEVQLSDPVHKDSALLIVKNTGQQTIRDVGVTLRCFVFRDQLDTSPTIFFQGYSTLDNDKAWWFISTLKSGQKGVKDLRPVLEDFMHNAEITLTSPGIQAGAAAQGRRDPPHFLLSNQLFAADFTTIVRQTISGITFPK